MKVYLCFDGFLKARTEFCVQYFTIVVPLLFQFNTNLHTREIFVIC